MVTTNFPAPALEGNTFFGLCPGPRQSLSDNRRQCQHRGEKAKQDAAAEKDFSRIWGSRRVFAHRDFISLPGRILHGDFKWRGHVCHPAEARISRVAGTVQSGRGHQHLCGGLRHPQAVRASENQYYLSFCALYCQVFSESGIF